MYNYQFDTHEFTYILHGNPFSKLINRGSVIEASPIEKNGELIGMVVYTYAIVIDPKTGVGVSATYKLDADEAVKFRDWWLWG